MTLNQIKSHSWFRQVNQDLNKGIVVGYDYIPVDKGVLASLKNFSIDPEVAQSQVESNKHDAVSAAYYLMLNKQVVSGGKSASYSDGFYVPRGVHSSLTFLQNINRSPITSRNHANRLSEPIVIRDNDRRALLTQGQVNRNIPNQLPSVKMNTSKISKEPISLSPAIRKYNRGKPKYKIIAADNTLPLTPSQRANKSRIKGTGLSESVDYSIKGEVKNFKVNPRMIGTADNFAFKAEYLH
jgi:hypothetical protein